MEVVACAVQRGKHAVLIGHDGLFEGLVHGWKHRFVVVEDGTTVLVLATAHEVCLVHLLLRLVLLHVRTHPLASFAIQLVDHHVPVLHN